jgi:hypothetical protein
MAMPLNSDADQDLNFTAIFMPFGYMAITG